jgi:CRISPR-associated endonuclease/helicase Cas3
MSIPFEAFFEAVWGYPPYPWQAELSRQVRQEGWPAVLDLPTGSGKTAVLDIALHHLAEEGGRSAPRRILMVVDRRVIVDQVGQRALKLLEALQNAEDAGSPERVSILGDMRNALRSIVGEDAPLLHTEVLRGGMVRRDAWATFPHTPVLAASTVDQVGSRLFFRGYGVSDGMRSVHAGLLGCDTLLLLDEVHLARPFAEVLAQLQRLREGAGRNEIPRRFQIVQLSATPGRSMMSALAADSNGEAADPLAEPAAEGSDPMKRGVFRLRDQDRTTPRLERVLRASKPATLEPVEVKARSGEEVKRRTVAERAARHAREMVKEGRRAVAVVVNRVDTARRAWALLQERGFDAELITGRMRPLDQEDVIARIEPRVMAGRPRNPEARPIVVVATQCIEAGADYDFDGLVTECASLDALRQRFGRLDRTGRYAPEVASDASRGGLQLDAFAVEDTSRTSRAPEASARAVILMRSDYLGSVEDPVYGLALRETWEWLTEISASEEVDFGIEAIQPHLEAAGERLEKMLAPHRDAPVLLPSYLDQWAQTNPKPHADPDVSLFLHGIPEDARAALPDVQVVWRSDLTEEDLAPAQSEGELEKLREHLAMAPPGSLEAMSLPVWTVQRWLSEADGQTQDDDVADVEGRTGLVEEPAPRARRVLLWRGSRRSEPIGVSEIAPGSTVVVPESYGGIGVHGTFDPDAKRLLDAGHGGVPVYDLGDVVQLRQRGSPTLRLDPRVLRPLVGELDVAALLPDPEAEEVEPRAVLRDALRVLRENDHRESPGWFPEVLAAVRNRPRFVLSPRGFWVALGRRSSAMGGRGATLHVPVAAAPDRAASVFDPTGDGEPENESFTGGATAALLTDHLSGVEELAERFARQVQLPPRIVSSVKWAARLHDVGKADPRFQLWLHGGDEISARFGDLLAKSAIPWQNVLARREARRRARYPEGQRHELVSLEMIERSSESKARVEADGGDWELVLHLVASHHGWCRPLAPVLQLASGEGDAVSFPLEGTELAGSTAHERDRLASGVTARFWRLNHRYGWHELAYLEAILRLADHRRSAWEAEQ